MLQWVMTNVPIDMSMAPQLWLETPMKAALQLCLLPCIWSYPPVDSGFCCMDEDLPNHWIVISAWQHAMPWPATQMYWSVLVGLTVCIASTESVFVVLAAVNDPNGTEIYCPCRWCTHVQASENVDLTLGLLDAKSNCQKLKQHRKICWHVASYCQYGRRFMHAARRCN